LENTLSDNEDGEHGDL
jgi:hypothetical protein